MVNSVNASSRVPAQARGRDYQFSIVSLRAISQFLGGADQRNLLLHTCFRFRDIAIIQNDGHCGGLLPANIVENLLSLGCKYDEDLEGRIGWALDNMAEPLALQNIKVEIVRRVLNLTEVPSNPQFSSLEVFCTRKDKFYADRLKKIVMAGKDREVVLLERASNPETPPEQALEIALMLQDSISKDKAVLEIIARSEPQQGVKIAKQITDVGLRNSAFRSLVLRSNLTVDEALQITRQYHGNIQFVDYLLWYCIATEEGHLRTDDDRALAVISRITDQERKDFKISFLHTTSLIQTIRFMQHLSRGCRLRFLERYLERVTNLEEIYEAEKTHYELSRSEFRAILQRKAQLKNKNSCAIC